MPGVQAVLDWLNKYLFETVWCAVRRAWCWIADVLIGASEWVVEQVASAFPTLPDHSDSINAAAEYLGLVNAWLPLAEVVVMMSGLVVWVVFRTVAGWFVRLLPFVG